MNNTKKQSISVGVFVGAFFLVVGFLFGADSVFAATSLSDEYNPTINPAEFSTTIDNKYFSLPVGLKTKSKGETEDGLETIEITVPGETKMIMGVKTLVYRDKVWIDGELVEDTKDYLAQDSDGNVWYFGEDVNNYENGKLTDHDGSWIAGVDGALPGIWMKAKPVVGEIYRQEYYKDEAEDTGTVISLKKTVTVPAGTFTNCLQTLDQNPLEPRSTDEYKYFCPEVKGFALEVGVADGERIELTNVKIQNNASSPEVTRIKKMQTLVMLLQELVALLEQQLQQTHKVSTNKFTVTPEMKEMFTERVVSMNSDRWTVKSIAYDPMCDGSEAYDVTALSITGDPRSFIFDRSGKFIQSEIDESFDDAPASFMKLLKEKYVSYTYGDTFETLTMANGEKRYLIDVSNDGGKTERELILSLEGKLLCQSK
jgi:hypothetical protein